MRRHGERATADLGIAIGAGADLAVEAGDVALVRSDARDMPRIVELSNAAYRKMVQNLWWADGIVNQAKGGGMSWKATVVGAVAMLAIGSVGAVATVFSGAVNVAATDAEAGPTEWLLGTTMERSVRARAAAVGEPIAVDSALLVHGFEHYDAMCVDCHGAPGVDRGEYGQGLNPEPPELAEEASEWTDAELFWITKHGIKMTGMPGFGPTHSDEELWAVVAAVRRLEEMSPEAYREMIAAASGEHSHDDDEAAAEGHTHAPGTPPHEH